MTETEADSVVVLYERGRCDFCKRDIDVPKELVGTAQPTDDKYYICSACVRKAVNLFKTSGRFHDLNGITAERVRQMQEFDLLDAKTLIDNLDRMFVEGQAPPTIEQMLVRVNQLLQSAHRSTVGRLMNMNDARQRRMEDEHRHIEEEIGNLQQALERKKAELRAGRDEYERLKQEINS